MLKNCVGPLFLIYVIKKNLHVCYSFKSASLSLLSPFYVMLYNFSSVHGKRERLLSSVCVINDIKRFHETALTLRPLNHITSWLRNCIYTLLHVPHIRFTACLEFSRSNLASLASLKLLESLDVLASHLSLPVYFPYLVLPRSLIIFIIRGFFNCIFRNRYLSKLGAISSLGVCERFM